VQVAAVHGEIRGAEERLGHRQLAHHLAGIPLAVQVGVTARTTSRGRAPRCRCAAGPSSSWASSGCRPRSAQNPVPARRPGPQTRRAGASMRQSARPVRPRRWRLKGEYGSRGFANHIKALRAGRCKSDPGRCKSDPGRCKSDPGRCESDPGRCESDPGRCTSDVVRSQEVRTFRRRRVPDSASFWDHRIGSRGNPSGTPRAP
jgi:hypothetical protein